MTLAVPLAGGSAAQSPLAVRSHGGPLKHNGMMASHEEARGRAECRERDRVAVERYLMERRDKID